MSYLKIPSGWLKQLDEETHKDYFIQLSAHIEERIAFGVKVFPPRNQIFSALQITPFEQVKVVIIGQDPYHGPNQANGLSFSVHCDQKQPPSLRNIFKALEQDLAIAPASHGDLTAWAKQGVLLLNAVLTVEQAAPNSHANMGWEQFTDAIIRSLNQSNHRIVFMLWGKYAQNKQKLIDLDKHSVLTSAHPSPLSAYRGFFDCQHFSKTNQILVQDGQALIQWASDEKSLEMGNNYKYGRKDSSRI